MIVSGEGKIRLKSFLGTRMNSLEQQEGGNWGDAAPGSLLGSDFLEEGEKQAEHCAQS